MLSLIGVDMRVCVLTSSIISPPSEKSVTMQNSLASESKKASLKAIYHIDLPSTLGCFIDASRRTSFKVFSLSFCSRLVIFILLNAYVLPSSLFLSIMVPSLGFPYTGVRAFAYLGQYSKIVKFAHHPKYLTF